MKVSVVVPTHCPDEDRLSATLRGLQEQTLSKSSWELLIIDNGSVPEIGSGVIPSLFRGHARLIQEPVLGLSRARLRGVLESQSELIVFADDDNVLAPTYLEQSLELFSEYRNLGVAGGKSVPVYDCPQPAWYFEGMAPLGCRDLGNEPLFCSGSEFLIERRYPSFAPIGAGMVFRKEAIETWTKSVESSEITDRKGDELSSAGDCDIVLHALDAGWDVAYWPSLSLHHLIPRIRLQLVYLKGISRAAYRDFVRVLDLHSIRPWPAIPEWTIPLRATKAWFNCRAWRGPKEQIHWQGLIGQYEGRATLIRQ